MTSQDNLFIPPAICFIREVSTKKGGLDNDCFLIRKEKNRYFQTLKEKGDLGDVNRIE